MNELLNKNNSENTIVHIVFRGKIQRRIRMCGCFDERRKI